MLEDPREHPGKQELRTLPAAKESNKKRKYDYKEQLKQDFGRIFEALTLTKMPQEYLRSRWLDQVLWTEGKANSARNRYRLLRLSTIIGGVLLPALVSWNINIKNPSNNQDNRAEVFSGIIFVLSLGVAVSAAVEEFFHYGERWQHYRRTAESLKAQGWQFFELSGPYVAYKTHEEAFTFFADRVEDIIQQDVEVYTTQVMQEKKQKEEKEKQQA